MIGLTTINPLRSLGHSRRGLLVLDALSPGNPFVVGETHLGKAVFASRGFAEGERLVRFSGRRISAARLGRQLATGLEGSGDRFVQIGADHYLGPSGRIDDLINHSCSPNAGLRFGDDGVFLVAIRPIAPGEEISWDYATTLGDPDWRLPCDWSQRRVPRDDRRFRDPAGRATGLVSGARCGRALSAAGDGAGGARRIGGVRRPSPIPMDRPRPG